MLWRSTIYLTKAHEALTTTGSHAILHHWIKCHWFSKMRKPCHYVLLPVSPGAFALQYIYIYIYIYINDIYIYVFKHMYDTVPICIYIYLFLQAFFDCRLLCWRGCHIVFPGIWRRAAPVRNRMQIRRLLIWFSFRSGASSFRAW